MRIVFDASQETMYPLAREGFSGGSQVYIKQIIKGMVKLGHTVHVIANDLEVDEQRGDTEFWWPTSYHPHEFDIAVQQMHCNPNPDYNAPILILMTSCVDPNLGPEHKWASAVDAIPVFSEVHKKLLLQMRPTITEEKCFLTGLGVDLDDYLDPGFITMLPLSKAPTKQDRLAKLKVPGRMLYANDPARGLFYTLDVFDLVKKKVPEATLHVAYDFDTQLSWRMWEHSQMAQMLLECKKRIDSTPGVVNLGGITRAEIIREQLECQVHCYPADPPGVGTQTHGITQMECAAAGAALVLSDIEAFPEVFGEGAVILPVIGKYIPEVERRTTAADYAEVVIDLMKKPKKWQKASRQARALAEKNTWERVITNWDAMITKLVTGVGGSLENPTIYALNYQQDATPNLVPLVEETHPRLVWMLNQIGPTDDVLDMGCHKGEFTSHVARKTTGRVVGIDLSLPAIRDAQAYYHDLPNVEWLVRWAEETQLDTASFDIVVLGELLEHVIDPDQLLEEAERLVKPNGRIVITVPKDAIALENAGRSETDTRPHEHLRDYDPAKELAGKADLRVEDITHDGYTWHGATYLVNKLAEGVKVD